MIFDVNTESNRIKTSDFTFIFAYIVAHTVLMPSFEGEYSKKGGFILKSHQRPCPINSISLEIKIFTIRL